MTTTDPTRVNVRFDPTKRRMFGWTNHGNHRIDVEFMTQVADNLWVGGCETGLILPEFIKHVVSLYPWERYGINHKLQSELYVQMYDSEEQGFEQVDALAAWVNVCRSTGPTLVHCQAGLNRSALVAARALILEGETATDAIDTLRTFRSPAVLCNQAFETWLREIEAAA